MIGNLFNSFGIGCSAYMLASMWIALGNVPPTPKTHGIGFILCSIGLAFWLISFVLYCIEDFKN